MEAPHLGKAAGWKMVPELREFLLNIFRGFGQSVIIEKAFHFARDEETSDQASKQMANVRRWAAPVRHSVLSQFGREEVQAATSLPVPALVPKQLFKACVGKETHDPTGCRGVY